MNAFKKIPGEKCVTNDSGVIVYNHGYHRECGGDVAYKTGGIKYLIPYDYWHDTMMIELVRGRRDGQMLSGRSMLPKELLIQMREDLPQALAKLGSKMEFAFTRIPDTSYVTNGCGVIVDFGYSRHSVSYELDGVKYEIYDFDIEMAGFYSHQRELDMSNIWLAGKGLNSKAPVSKSMLTKMREDLPNAYAAFGLKFKFKN